MRASLSRQGSPTDLRTVRELRETDYEPERPQDIGRRSSVTNSRNLPSKRGGLLQMYGTTPTVPLSSSVTSSSGSNNSAGATPRAGIHQLPEVDSYFSAPARRVSVQRGVGVGHAPVSHNALPTESTPLLSAPSTGKTPTKPTWAPEHLSPLNSPSRSRRGSRGSEAYRRASARRPVGPPHVGDSSDGQTLFNAVAVLVGIGLLSMPLAFSYAGWIGGTFMLIGFSFITCTTAKMLSKLIFADTSLVGYTDIGKRAFGPAAGGAINLL